MNCNICQFNTEARNLIRVNLHIIGSEGGDICETFRINLSRIAVMMKEATIRAVVAKRND